MQDEPVRLTCDIELQPGEQLRLPESLLTRIGPRRWRLAVPALRRRPVRSHAAFLDGCAPEDEGLYDASIE
jgi:hypothetical protein